MTTDDLKRRAVETWSWFRAWPLGFQLAAALLVLLVALAAFGKLETVYSHTCDFIFNARAQKAEAERDKVKAERDDWVKIAVEAEARAQEAERGLAPKKQQDAASAAAVTTADADVERIASDTQARIDAVGADNLTPDERVAMRRAALHDLGYLP